MPRSVTHAHTLVRSPRTRDAPSRAGRAARAAHALDRAHGAPRITAELNDSTSPVNTPDSGRAQSPIAQGAGDGQLLKPVN